MFKNYFKAAFRNFKKNKITTVINVLGLSIGISAALIIFKKQQQIVFADNNYFSIFPYEWIAGNAKSSLINPYQLVLSESRAQQYFHNTPVSQLIGKTVVFSDTIRTTITGIVKDLKQNSDFKYDAFISLSTLPSGTL